MGIQITDAVSVDNKTIIVNSGGMLEAQTGWKEIFNFELSETLSGSNIFNIDMGSHIEDFDFNKYDYMFHLLDAETDQSWHSLRVFQTSSVNLPSSSTANNALLVSMANAKLKGLDENTIWFEYGAHWINGLVSSHNRNNNLYIRISQTGSVSKFHFKIYVSEKL